MLRLIYYVIKLFKTSRPYYSRTRIGYPNEEYQDPGSRISITFGKLYEQLVTPCVVHRPAILLTFTFGFGCSADGRLTYPQMGKEASRINGVWVCLLALLLSLDVLRCTEASEVITLTDENFQEQVENNDTWLVDFYGKCEGSSSGNYVMVGVLITISACLSTHL